MPIYFEMKSDSQPLTDRTNADAWSEILQDALKAFDLRVVSIRSAPDLGYIYACAVRHRPIRGTIVKRLRHDKRLTRFAFSTEGESAEGPFRWPKK